MVLGRGGMRGRGRGRGAPGMKQRPPFIPHVPFDVVLAVRCVLIVIVVPKTLHFKGVRLNAELGINFHNFFVFWIWMMQFGTERTNGCYFLVLKGFFANINVKLKNPMDSYGVVVELAME